MGTYALIPVRLHRAKTRLAAVLSEEERTELVKHMLLDVMESVKNMECIVVVGPEEVNEILTGYDFELLREDKARGLNNASIAGNRRAMELGADSTLFIPADTPLIQEQHIQDILELGKEHPLVISPSSRGGTGILYRRPPDIIDERFTSKSYEDYQEEAREMDIELFVYDSFALSLDIDTPEDIKEFMLLGNGTRAHSFLDNKKE